jgi:hypothetical protein
MISEPQRAYVLELLNALGPAGDSFVLAGAQALKFAIPHARATRDFDFILDVIGLQQPDIHVAKVLESLGYVPDPKARNFHFEKPIPSSKEVMRIELMAPAEFKRRNDFRVDIGNNVHARECVGGSIVLAESDYHDLSGLLPDGRTLTTRIRVARPNALVMLKCLAMDDRYKSQRGPAHYEYDRQEASVHAADIVSVLRAQVRMDEFKQAFWGQFPPEPHLKQVTMAIVQGYFSDETKPGLMMYREYLGRQRPSNETSPEEILHEVHSARRLLAGLIGG